MLNNYIYNLMIETWFDEIETYILRIENIFTSARIELNARRYFFDNQINCLLGGKK